VILSRIFVVVVVLAGFGPANAADDKKPKIDLTTPSLQERDLSLGLKTGKDASVATGAPSGLKPLSHESNKPFVGLSLTKPISK
jgi:hypothetical protein